MGLRVWCKVLGGGSAAAGISSQRRTRAHGPMRHAVPPFSILPIAGRFRRRMITLRAAQDAALSAGAVEKLHFFSVSKMLADRGRVLLGGTDGTGEAWWCHRCFRAQGPTPLCILEKKKCVGVMHRTREKLHIVRVVSFPFWARFSVFGKGR